MNSAIFKTKFKVDVQYNIQFNIRVRILIVVARVDFFQKGILKTVGTGNSLQKIVHFPSPSPRYSENSKYGVLLKGFWA